MSDTLEPTVSISLTTRDSNAALDFYTQAFGAKELYRMPSPEGGVAHGEFLIGNTKLFISDESEEWNAFAIKEGEVASCLFSIAVGNCDEAFEKAVKAGGVSLSDPENKFWGGRSAIIKDPYGYRWSLIQVVEEVSLEEVEKRAKELFQ